MVQVEEHLPSKCKVLSSSPSNVNALYIHIGRSQYNLFFPKIQLIFKHTYMHTDTQRLEGKKSYFRAIEGDRTGFAEGRL
jgi:hypothetical protein